MSTHNYFLLKEDRDYLLQEDGFKIVLDGFSLFQIDSQGKVTPVPITPEIRKVIGTVATTRVRTLYDKHQLYDAHMPYLEQYNSMKPSDGIRIEGPKAKIISNLIDKPTIKQAGLPTIKIREANH